MTNVICFRPVTVLLLLLLHVLVGNGCIALPPPPPQPETEALPPASTGLLSETADRVTSDLKATDSGYLLLPRNEDALNWRLALADHATTSIDAQYFIWQKDATGDLLFDRLLKAADRGVRVRLLIDDFWLADSDKEIAAISRHPNFEIRIFNPTFARHAVAGWLEFLAYFHELNRRMHNKLFIADNRMAIVGGRNIGDAYFGLSKRYNFQDLDVLTAGPVVTEISAAFDEYWNAELAYPGYLLSNQASTDDLEAFRQRIQAYIAEHAELLASYPVTPQDWSGKMAELPQHMHSGEGHFLQDDPIVVRGEQIKLYDMLDTLAAPDHEEVIMVSPYLIPVRGMLEELAELHEEGVKVRILTASMASNNHTIAHSHYKKYRRRLMAAGTELHEYRHQPSEAMREKADVPPVRARFISLHAKATVGDRQRCFIGSLNLDPRAIEINTENGLYIESPELAAELAELLDTMMHPDNSWRVHLDEEDRTLYWQSSEGIVRSQPARSFSQRIADFFFRLLPVESQL